MALIRTSRDCDLKAICEIHRKTFGKSEGQDIADLVSDLMKDHTALPLHSLLAEMDHMIIGHVLFTHVKIQEQQLEAQILAPLAVLPAFQKQGIGGALIREGLKSLIASGVGLVFVLGHPEYYPRFGFKPAGIIGLEAPHPIPEEHQDAWMVQELQPGILGKTKGTVTCARALNDPKHW